LVYAPITEGWGLPPVEAMAAGTPVVASPMPSTGEAALTVDPTDVSAMTAAIVRAAADETCREELRDAGLARAGELTWAKAAATHVDLWRSLQ
jgi:glycosyltransferase involved in cell wall biosynthesis